MTSPLLPPELCPPPLASFLSPLDSPPILCRPLPTSTLSPRARHLWLLSCHYLALRHALYRNHVRHQVEHYLVLFLKFISSVVPTISYDYTMAVGA